MKSALILLMTLLAGSAMAGIEVRTAVEQSHLRALQTQKSAEEECSEKHGNQADVKACLSALLAQAEQDRRHAEIAALAAMKQLDRIQQRKKAVPAQEKEIKAYAAYRDAHCAWVAASYGSGAGAGIAEAACLIDLDRARAHALSIYYMR